MPKIESKKGIDNITDYFGEAPDLGAYEFESDSFCEANGDVNEDGNLNVLDIVALVNVILGSTFLSEAQTCSADVNEDGNLNVLDIVAIVNLILGL